MFDSGPCDWLVLPRLLLTPTTQFSLDHKLRRRKRNRKKWKRSDSSDSDSVELMTPLATPIFDFHQVIRSLTTPTMTPTPTPSLMKANLEEVNHSTQRLTHVNHHSLEIACVYSQNTLIYLDFVKVSAFGSKRIGIRENLK